MVGEGVLPEQRAAPPATFGRGGGGDAPGGEGTAPKVAPLLYEPDDEQHKAGEQGERDLEGQLAELEGLMRMG